MPRCTSLGESFGSCGTPRQVRFYDPTTIYHHLTLSLKHYDGLGLTTVLRTEGPWDRVHQVIGQAHTLLHQQGIVRIQTDIRVGSR